MDAEHGIQELVCLPGTTHVHAEVIVDLHFLPSGEAGRLSEALTQTYIWHPKIQQKMQIHCGCGVVSAVVEQQGHVEAALRAYRGYVPNARVDELH